MRAAAVDSKLDVRYVRPGDLRPRAYNPRTHSRKQIGQIADSIKRFGFNNAILIDRHGQVIAGHGRLEAAKLLGLEEVPTIRLEDLSEAEIRAYVIADNKLAENAGWDPEILALELQGLMELDLDFDLEITGFETAEIDILIEEITSVDEDPEDEVPPVDDGLTITRPADVWQIGPHRLICGDSLNPSVYEKLLGSERAQCIFTDPPYNVQIDGHVCGLGKVKHREFRMASGEMTEAEFTAFLERVFKNLAAVSVDCAIHFICIDWRHIGEVIAAAKPVYSELKNLCIWAKSNGGMGSLYRSQHELVFVYKVGKGRHINNVELGRYGRYRTNVWDYRGVNAFGGGRDEALEMHPTMKPVALVADAILDCSRRGGIILDAFAGSGTTLLAAERTGRRACAIELEPHYVDVAIRRFQNATGIDAVHADTGRTFAETEADRQVERGTSDA